MFRALFAITKIAFITATITAITSFHIRTSIYDSFHISCRSLVKLLFLHVSICFYEMIQFQASQVICQRSVFFNRVSDIRYGRVYDRKCRFGPLIPGGLRVKSAVWLDKNGQNVRQTLRHN